MVFLFCLLLLLLLLPQEDLLIHGDSVYDIIDKQDHQNVQNELGRPPGSSGGGSGPHAVVTPADDARIFLCRMNVSRNARRQMRFGDQKVLWPFGLQIITASLSEQKWLHSVERGVTGDIGRGSLCVLPAAVHAERAGADRHLHASRHAGDARVRRTGSHQHFHLRSQHGHEIRLHRRQVRDLYRNYTISQGKQITAGITTVWR